MLMQSIHQRLRRLKNILGLTRSVPLEELHPADFQAQMPLLPPSPLPEQCRLIVVGYGATSCHWSIHAWLQRCSLPPNFQLSDCSSSTPVGLHLQPVSLSLERGALDQLRGLGIVLDPKIERVHKLRELGLEAYWLDPQGTSSHWLDEEYDAATASRVFGLPNPEILQAHGRRLCLGSAGDSWEQQLQSPNWGLPGFCDLHVADAAAARLLAGWLNACNRLGLQLIWLNPSDYEYHSQPLNALDRPQGEGHEDWLPPIMINGPIDGAGLDAELTWVREGQQVSPECPTPSPDHQVLWTGGSVENGDQGQQPAAAVCISLYNYSDRILSALDSVYAQTQKDLELIVVDDASTDEGCQVVRQWLDRYGQRFQRALLFSHTKNSGLASARNTAFAAAKADWCFVLDADNRLQPNAVALCLAIALSSPADTAVVHPLVELHSEAVIPGLYNNALLTKVAWQKQILEHSNQVDAMALIRRHHWQIVGGYSHIPGGWEDYDFWCKLIDAGYHGVLCPQRLAVYNRHSSSMQATSTVKSMRTLKRLLTARHPWLRLESHPHP